MFSVPLLLEGRAAIADFHGVPHNLDRRRHYLRYQEMTQRVYEGLRHKYPNYTPPTRFKRFPGLWLDDACRCQILALPTLILLGFALGLDSALALFALWLLFWPLILAAWWLDNNIISPPDGKREWGWLLGFLAVPAGVVLWPLFSLLVQVPWNYVLVGGSFEKLGRTERDFTKLLRDFKAKHPQQWAQLAYDANVRNGFYPDPVLYGMNSREAWLLLRAGQNVNNGPIWAHQQGRKNPYISDQTATELVRRVAAGR